MYADFIYTNANVHTNFYINFLTKELYLANGETGINCCVQWENT